MTDWPQYESHKVVRAAQIKAFDVTAGERVCAMVDNPSDEVLFEKFNPTVAEMLDRAEIGDWAILYDDGFKSISPAKAFEEGYRPVGPQAVVSTHTLSAERPGRPRLVTHNNVIGHMARWAVVQHPYARPEGLFDLGDKVTAAAQSWDTGPPSCKMREFTDWREFEKWLIAALADDPILKQWNTPRSGHTQQIVATSRYWGPKAEDDIIDIDAWVRNVARSVWATAGEE